ncbi:MAG: S4 domain-containing protein [Firmicutes bacterium]|nr:S4 domain-containing protein [Bacillota bacterium]MDH7496438.1 S4 domain-containing protein [Bacillota bacterium]
MAGGRVEREEGGTEPGLERRTKVVKGTVARLRLDAVASLGFGVSRTAMAEEIKRGRVAVNGVRRLDPSFGVKPCDVMTLEGRGNVRLAHVAGETRKGRTLVHLEREVGEGL